MKDSKKNMENEETVKHRIKIYRQFFMCGYSRFDPWRGKVGSRWAECRRAFMAGWSRSISWEKYVEERRNIGMMIIEKGLDKTN